MSPRALNRSEIMSRIRKKNTKPELAVRNALTRMGFRYRLHRSDLPGSPDIAFIGRRRAIFCHGCFWHQHGCPNTRTPRSNLAYWTPKLARNAARDRDARRALVKMGWKVLVVWECEISKASLPNRLHRFLTETHTRKNARERH